MNSVAISANDFQSNTNNILQKATLPETEYYVLSLVNGHVDKSYGFLWFLWDNQDVKTVLQG